jgi:hypothetical protein
MKSNPQTVEKSVAVILKVGNILNMRRESVKNFDTYI